MSEPPSYSPVGPDPSNEPHDCIIGIGSPHGDDSVGWCLAERLQSSVPLGARVVALREPIAALEHLATCRRAWLVDASQGTGEAGTITRLVWPDQRLRQHLGWSSHGVGLGEVLSLAHTLGRMPERLVLFTIEAAACRPGTGLSPPVEAAAARLLQTLQCELHGS